MGGALGKTVNQIATDFRANEQPNIMQVFDAGAATEIGATIPVQDLLSDNGVAFNIKGCISGVRHFFADSDGKMIDMPFNSSSPIMYFNVDALAAAGVTAPKTWEEFQTTTAPALADAGDIALSQSHLPWIFTENVMTRH